MTVLDPRRARRASFILDGAQDRNQADMPTGEAILDDHTVIVDLTGTNTSPLFVVRALIPGLIPITFGYHSEPLGLPSAAALAKAGWGGPPPPHPFP